jgi:ABC-type sugar transport system ATPase subunit
MRLAADDVNHMPPDPVLQLCKIEKNFAGVHALKGVDFGVIGGEVHALLGENGAGKSTLMRILFGVWQPNGGVINLQGTGAVQVHGPRHALSLGIGLVSQEPSIVPQLDVAQNIFLGHKSALTLSGRRELQRAARRILDTLAPNLSETAIVGSLGMAERQMVEIARALARGGRIIAFDEPTSSLTPSERNSLFDIIRGLKKSGKAIIYISHRMKEIHAIADRVTVLRDGSVVASGLISEFSSDALNTLIAGRELAQEMERRPAPLAQTATKDALKLEGLTTSKLHGVDLALHAGEIFGLAGLVGSGRTELVRAIFGADPTTSGRVFVEEKRVHFHSPADAIHAGVALIPEDRRGQSLVSVMTVEQNFGLANAGAFFRRGMLRGKYRRAEMARYIRDLGIRPNRPDAQIRNLSGGNQQKVVIAKWLKTGAKIFLFDEPTRGIDVGAKAEIHELLRTLTADGAAVLVISSEMPELLSLSHRIGVMRDGMIVKVLDNKTGVTEEHLMKLASGETV